MDELYVYTLETTAYPEAGEPWKEGSSSIALLLVNVFLIQIRLKTEWSYIVQIVKPFEAHF